MNNKKMILYISMSLDGFIAGNDDDISWLSIVENKRDDYGYEKFVDTIDTYIVGRQTYDNILKITGGLFPQAEQYRCFVITKHERPSENGVTFYNGDIETLVHQLKCESGKNIYCDGGGQIVKLLMNKNLIDEYIISIIPIILGDGKRLFLGDTPSFNLEAVSCKHYKSGLMQLHYKRT